MDELWCEEEIFERRERTNQFDNRRDISRYGFSRRAVVLVVLAVVMDRETERTIIVLLCGYEK